MSNGGGAATNAGIDFQHRVGAVAMLTMLTDLSGLEWLVEGTAELAATELRFETNDGVDDLVIVTDGPRIFIQAKRSLSLSEKIDSDYSLTLRQFVDQFLREASEDEMFVLATTPAASSRILTDLHKLTGSARLNELAPEVNPLSKVEQLVLDVTYRLIAQHFQEIGERAITDEERDQIFRRVRVAKLDLEDGGTLERAVLTALAGKTLVAPALVWGNLISLALTLAKRRESIDREALLNRFGGYMEDDSREPSAEPDEDAVRFAMAGNLPAGKEVVLIGMDEGMLLAELFRFADDGTRRFKFDRGDFELNKEIKGKLIRRSATVAGMVRMLRADPALAEDKQLLVAPINSETDPDSSQWATAHAELLKRLVDENPAPLECLQCGRPMSEDSAPIVEVDQEDEPHQVGLVHSSCLQPEHRVLGRVSGGALQASPLLRDLDAQAWFRSLPTGQGAFRGAADSLRGRMPTLGWKPGRKYRAIDNWGIAYELEDGSVRYVSERGRVLQLTEDQAKQQARVFNEHSEEAAKQNDPFCAGEQGFGQYSWMLQTDPTSQPVRVQLDSADARELTRATLAAHNSVENWYAPLMVVLNAESGSPYVIHGARVLLTNPLRLPDAVDNWTVAGLEVPPIATSVLETDAEFDSFVSESFRRSLGVVIDPILGPDANPLSGFLVGDIEPLLEDAGSAEEPD